MSLLLAPATRENLVISIEKPVEQSVAEKYLSNEFIKEIIKYSGIEGIRCWAMSKSKINIFNSIKNGDEVLLSETKTRKFTHYGIVVGKTQNLELGNALWPMVGNSPWEYIYFLANLTNIQLNKSEVVQGLGYSANFEVPGVIVVDEDRYKSWGTISQKYEIPVFDNVAEVEGEKDFSAENILSSGTRRDG